MNFFGTDGIRGIVGKTLNENLIKKIANGIVAWCKKNDCKSVLIGADGRISGDYILAILATKLLKYGVKIDYLGICSTPCLAFITRHFKYPIGIMISASHNPYNYNGIKFFNNNGEKVSDTFELNFEQLMTKKLVYSTNIYSCFKDASDLVQVYINYLKSLKTFKNYNNIVFDCANGGASKICKTIFNKCKIINCQPNGNNINVNSGCVDMSYLQNYCTKNNCIGFALDGDADRLNIVTPSGDILGGDEILYIFSKFYLKQNCNLVGTVYTNSALERSVSKRKITLIRSAVGDKCVYEQMLKHNAMLGGENSGHIIVKKYTNTGDGLLNAILILNILNTTNKSLQNLLQNYHPFTQLYMNIKIENFTPNKQLNKYISDKTKLDAKIIIRPSGTEPVLRVMVEHVDKNIATNILKDISKIIKNLNKNT